MRINNLKRYNKYKNNKLISEINVTPFVDVMLVLLIIFMITSPMIQADLDIDLPEAHSKPSKQDDTSLIISVRYDGKIYIRETQVTLYNLAKKVSAINKNKKDTSLFIKGDKKVNYGVIIQVIAELNKAGFNKVSLVTEPK